MVRLILAVVVGFTSVAALPVCENQASGSGCPINKGQCCNVIPRPFALGDGGVTRAMKTDDGSDRRVRPTGPTDGAEGPNAAPAPATKRGPLIRERPEKNQTKTQNKIPRAVPLPRLVPP